MTQYRTHLVLHWQLCSGHWLLCFLQLTWAGTQCSCCWLVEMQPLEKHGSVCVIIWYAPIYDTLSNTDYSQEARLTVDLLLAGLEDILEMKYVSFVRKSVFWNILGTNYKEKVFVLQRTFPPCLFFYHRNKNSVLNIRGQAFDHICRIKAFIRYLCSNSQACFISK